MPSVTIPGSPAISFTTWTCSRTGLRPIRFIPVSTAMWTLAVIPRDTAVSESRSARVRSNTAVGSPVHHAPILALRHRAQHQHRLFIPFSLSSSASSAVAHRIACGVLFNGFRGLDRPMAVAVGLSADDLVPSGSTLRIAFIFFRIRSRSTFTYALLYISIDHLSDTACQLSGQDRVNAVFFLSRFSCQSMDINAQGQPPRSRPFPWLKVPQ